VLGLDAATPAPPGGDKLWGDGFEVENLIHVRVAKAVLKVAEVPSYEYRRLHGLSNLNATTDGLRVVRTMLAEWRGGPAPVPALLPPKAGPSQHCARTIRGASGAGRVHRRRPAVRGRADAPVASRERHIA
jgi:hypothetical protein